MNEHLPQRKPNRYKYFDYSRPGYYFITICSHKMKHLFGEIINCKMVLNDAGKIVNNCWNEITNHFKDIELDYYQLMPNHLHGIIIINPSAAVNTNFAFTADRTKMILSKVIQQFKRKVTIEVNSLYKTSQPVWQKSFYDHIIRNEKELFNIRKYIVQNPLKWDINKNTSENLFV